MAKFQGEVGFALSVRDFLVNADGLPSVRIDDLVESLSGERGWVNGLYEDKVQILMLDEAVISPREMFKKSGKRLTITPSEFLLGRAINPIGTPIDGHGPVVHNQTTAQVELEQPALGIGARQFIEEQFYTGITLIDTLIPLGKGQRELIIGDARAGKTRFLIDVVNNQKGKGVVVVYCLIGKPTTAVRNLLDILKVNNCLPYTVVVAATSTDLPPLVFLAPKTALTVAEYFQKQGQDVLVILDDMGNHAKVHREISLLSNQYPGRESYPGDIFYQHAHLLERAGKFNKEAGGGSITLLPIIEINLNDFTTFIPNNLMSMTDGHLLFKSDLLNTGQHPAVDLGLSVSRVGRQTQQRLQNGLSTNLKTVLTEAVQYETLSRFSGELPQQTQIILRQKELVEELIKHHPMTNLSLNLQTTLLSLVFTNFLKFKEASFVVKNKNKLIQALITDPELKSVVEGVFEQFQTNEELVTKLEALSPKIQSYCQM